MNTAKRRARELARAQREAERALTRARREHQRARERERIRARNRRVAKIDAGLTLMAMIALAIIARIR